jgi:DEAD/DEAH box helicase domain-containing protein
VTTRASRRGAASDVDGIVRVLKSDPELRDRFVYWERIAAREGQSASFPARLDPRLVQLFEKRGMNRLHSHQAEAIEAALDGKDVLVCTPTASGKTLAYTAPVLQSLLESDGQARAIWMFPTKALSQDQSKALNSLIGELGEDWHSYTYDGDTPPSVRSTLRKRGHVVLTNPWMLHQGILPNHAKWAELFRGLEYIVIDEVHTLSGVMGSNVANVLRRLLRIAKHYGSNPRFLLSSATLRDPALHGLNLIGRPVHVVGEDGSPAGERILALHNPPMLDPVAGLRANALEEARLIARAVCGPHHQTIFFCNRRTAVEVLTLYLKENATKYGLRPDEVRGYRGGYLPLLRREIEDGLRAGEVKVVVTTNALELGIDVGRLDVAVLVGYPGSQASFWQRAGRVGRRGKKSLVVMIARSDPVDQYLAQNPEYLSDQPREAIGIDPDNLVILSEQLKCAAFELPFRQEQQGDEPAKVTDFGPSPHLEGILDYLTDELAFLHYKDGAWYWTADAYPAQDVSLAGSDPDNVVVLDAGTKQAIGEIDREGSITAVHDGAIYLVEGETWKIEHFDYQNRRAYARKVDSDYFTDAQTDTEVRVLRLEERRVRWKQVEERVVESNAAGIELGSFGDEGACEDYSTWCGEVHVTIVATLYKKIRFYTRENLGAEDIHLPPEEIDTEAFVLSLSEQTASELFLHAGDRGSAWHGLGELLRRVVPLYLRCQPGDFGLSTQIKSTHFKRPALFLYDRVRGGIGLARALFANTAPILEAAKDVLESCECHAGCPACVGPAAEIGPLSKETILTLLEHLLAEGSFEDAPIPNFVSELGL